MANPAVSASTMVRQVCLNCHGVTGNLISPKFPNLAGQTAPYLVAQLDGFKSRSRRDPRGVEYMWGLSRSLTDEQIKGLADHYADQTPVAPSTEGDRSRLEAGKAIFVNGIADQGVPACATCHGAQAKGNATFPRLAGQHADYVVKQLEVLQGTDERPDGSVMQLVASKLTKKNMQDVAAYLQWLPNF